MTDQNNNNKIHITESSNASNPSNSATNVLDANPTTIFSSKGIDAYIDTAVDKNNEYNTILIGFFRGDERKTKFLVTKLLDDDDSGKFEPVVPHIFVSSGETNNPQAFHFEKTKTSKFRVSFLGNIDNNHFKAKGKLHSSYIQSLPSAYKNHQAQKTQDVGPDKQFFSLRALSFSNTPEVKLEKIKELEDKEHNNNCDREGCKCVCYRCNSEHVTKGVCQECGRDAGCSSLNYKFVVEQFPLTFDHSQNAFVHIKLDEEEEDEEEETASSVADGKERTKKNSAQKKKFEEKIEKEKELNKDIADKVEQKDEVSGLKGKDKEEKKDNELNKTDYHVNIDSPLLSEDNGNNEDLLKELDKQDEVYHDDGNSGESDDNLLSELDKISGKDTDNNKNNEFTLSNSKKRGKDNNSTTIAGSSSIKRKEDDN
jgi:hypothetical protein